MAHPHTNNPVISELDEIASELEKTGNADLATLVDEVSAELLTAKNRTVSAKKKKQEEKPAPKARSKKNRKPAKKEADTNHGSRRARIAAAMRKIARAQVAELEDIASELVKEGDKKAALEILRIAEDLDSDYDYSATGKHSAPAGKGDASKLYNREKANKPDAKMDAEEKERLELPFGEKGEGYPVKQSAFDKQLDNLIRLAMEDAPEGLEGLDAGDSADSADEDMDMADESADSMDEDSEEESDEDSDEDDGDLDMGGLDGDEEDGGSDDSDADDMDLDGLDLGDGDDELAAMMDAMDSAEPADMEASDRMYGADDEAAEGDEGDEGGEFSMPPAAGEESSEEDDLALDGGEEDMSDLDDDSDKEALDLMPNLEVSGPMGTGMKFSSADKIKMLNLAKKLSAKGERGLAARVAKLAKK